MFRPSHGISFLRHYGIFVNIAGAFSPYNGIFNNWEEFYQWFQNYVANNPDAQFHIIGCGDGYNMDAPFRIEWFGGGVFPVEHRNTCTLSRWHPESGTYAEISPELTTHGTAKATLDRLHFIYANGTEDHKAAIATFNIDAVFINSDGTVS